MSATMACSTELVAQVAAERQSTAMLLAHLAEVDARELFLPAACTSMHVYCTRVLHLSDEAAFKRIRAARAARRFPQLFDAIADGRLHLSGVVVLAAHLTAANVDALIRRATHLRKRDIEAIAAELAPQPDVKTSLRRLPARTETSAPREATPTPAPPSELSPGTVAAPSATERPTTKTAPLAPGRHALRVTIDQTTRDKLERAQALLRHTNPSGDLAEVIDRALDALLAKIEQQKFGKTARPRARTSNRASADPSYVSNQVRREVHDRDDEQCAFVSTDGVRCGARGFLEFDHGTPVARGGTSTTKTVRLYCSAHNQYAAEQLFGKDFMRGKREAAKAARAAGAPSAVDERQVTFDERLRERADDGSSRCAEGSLDALRRKAARFAAVA